jgi:YgiT-type zinc finger domain-containing protein
MKCFICNQADAVPGMASVLLERGRMSLTVNHVPAQVCPNCGEAYTDETVAANLLDQAEQMARNGTKVDTCEYGQIKEARESE